MDARQGRRGKRISRQQEERSAAQLGGRTMAASGATRLGGGADVRVMGKIRLECKVTEKDSYGLKISELEKLRKQAIKTLEYAVFQFAFRGTAGRLKQYAVIQWDGKQAPEDHNWMTSSKQMNMTENELDFALSSGKIMMTFANPGPAPLSQRMFEILHWDEFLKRQNENA